MSSTLIEYIALFAAAVPFVYYLLAIYSSLKFFRMEKRKTEEKGDFAPPVSILKPVRGLDSHAFENFSSFCRQNYPEYELLFCVTDSSDPAVPIIEKIIERFPEHKIRLLFSAGMDAVNDKVAKLGLMMKEAQYEYLAISDSDVRVEANYLRTVVAPLKDPKVGGATCFYVSSQDALFIDHLQTIGMISDFYASVLVDWNLEGVSFALGPTMVSTKTRVRQFGGFQVLENRPADDFLFGRLIAAQGVEVRLLPYAVETVPDYDNWRGLLAKRLRWMTVIRNMRPWGHFGLLFTWSLPWCLFAVAVRPTAAVAFWYLGAYLACRLLVAWIIGIYGLRQEGLAKRFILIPLWDTAAFLVWLMSFTRSSIQWRGVEYTLRDGQLVLPKQPLAHSAPSQD